VLARARRFSETAPPRDGEPAPSGGRSMLARWRAAAPGGPGGSAQEK
jgi:hypothetical protein